VSKNKYVLFAINIHSSLLQVPMPFNICSRNDNDMRDIGAGSIAEQWVTPLSQVAQLVQKVLATGSIHV
jgi:hypothetical protein